MFPSLLFHLVSHQWGIILCEILIFQTETLIHIRIHNLHPIALIYHDSFDEESPNLVRYDQCVIMWLGGSYRVIVVKDYPLFA